MINLDVEFLEPLFLDGEWNPTAILFTIILYAQLVSANRKLYFVNAID